MVSDREPERSKDLIAAGGVAAPPAAETGSRHGGLASLAEVLAKRMLERPINWSEQRRAAPWYLIR